MSLNNEVSKWRYINIIHVVAVQMQLGITTSQKMLLIFEVEEYSSNHTPKMNKIFIFKENIISFGLESWHLGPSDKH